MFLAGWCPSHYGLITATVLGCISVLFYGYHVCYHGKATDTPA
jgi:hypothetical protein